MSEEQSARPSPARIVIIGAGVSGLAAAHRLVELCAEHERSVEVRLVEASGRAGGIIETERREGFLLEGGPDSFISEKPEALRLAERLGLASELIETNPLHRRSFVVRAGRLHPTPEGFQLLAPSRLTPFLTSKIFSWRGKARMALDLVLPRRAARHDASFADESLAAFVRRRLGREALERMAQPMVGGIYTADPELLSLRATMPRFLEMERRHRSLILAMWRAGRRERRAQSNGRDNAPSPQSEAAHTQDSAHRPQGGGANARAGADAASRASGARYSLFLSFAGGMQRLVERLTERLPSSSLHLNTRAESLRFDPRTKQWQVRLRRQAASESAGDAGERLPEMLTADAVCLALPAYAAASLLSEVDGELSAELSSIAYASTATVNLAYDRAAIPHALDGFGFVSPFIEGRAVLACTFSSVKFGGRAPEGYALLRAFVGGALQPEMFALDEEAMTQAVRRDLRQLLGIERAPLFARVQKWPRSMAQYHVGHLSRLAHIRQRLDLFPTLRLAGNAYHGAGIPDCIRSGETAAEEMLEAIR